MIKVFSPSREPLAILENAFGISYERRFNEIWTASFSLPLNDEKNQFCEPLNIIELYDHEEYIGKFLIAPAQTRKNENAMEITYNCRHVLSSLLDDVLFLDHYAVDMSTKDTIQYLLNQQEIKHWAAGQVDFNYGYSYKWENENGLLGPVLEIPKPFVTEYQWTHDDQVYPYELNLVEPEQEVTCELRYGLNQRGIERDVDPSGIVNRIYPLGYGEGINQLTIKDVNGGIPYLEDAESIAKYGLKRYIWIDRRIENAEVLKGNGQALLNKWKDPKITIRGNAADISRLTGVDSHKLRMGRLVRLDDPELGIQEARILVEGKTGLKETPWNARIEIASKTETFSELQADLDRRLDVNDKYAFGSTNQDSHDFEDNADSNNPAIMKFFLPDELLKLNKLNLTFECTNFRSYGKATKAAGQTVISTTAEAGGSQTISKTSASGGGETVTAEAGGDHYHRLFVGGVAAGVNFIKRRYFAFLKDKNVATSVNFEADADGDIYTYEASGGHSHLVRTSPHTHQFQVDIDPHTHIVKVTVPSHLHEVEHGIYLLDQLPTAVTIKIDGVTVPYTAIEGEEIDLIPYIPKDANGKVTRGKHVIEIKPNNLARISAQVTSQFFIQSRGQYSL